MGNNRFAFHCVACGCAHSINDRWGFNGDLENPTITPSILVNGDPRLLNPAVPRCHSFVTNGKIHYLEDCTHLFAGQTIDLPDFDL